MEAWLRTGLNTKDAILQGVPPNQIEFISMTSR